MHRHQTSERDAKDRGEDREIAGKSVDDQNPEKKGNRKHNRGKGQSRFEEAQAEIRDVIRSA